MQLALFLQLLLLLLQEQFGIVSAGELFQFNQEISERALEAIDVVVVDAKLFDESLDLSPGMLLLAYSYQDEARHTVGYAGKIHVKE